MNENRKELIELSDAINAVEEYETNAYFRLADIQKQVSTKIDS